ncbi:MAG TPA: STAS domain-containing protein [Bacteroidia bacterium]|nr:STAS domain-containing protein [Bacteroidia bacterium]MBN8693445.1 STAS domain-containing protein [Bacteroidota bacterium]HRD41029.1 STAS domain-containing protein [Bacteroidia bacterium]
MLFEFSISEKNKCTIVSLTGELIEKNQAADLIKKVEELVAAGNNKIALNLEGLKYMNSSGLNTLIQLLTKTRNSGGETVIYNMNKKINELLLITKLNTLFKIVDSEDQALKLLSV